MSDQDSSWTQSEGKCSNNHHNLVCTINEKVIERTEKILLRHRKGQRPEAALYSGEASMRR